MLIRSVLHTNLNESLPTNTDVRKLNLYEIFFLKFNIAIFRRDTLIARYRLIIFKNIYKFEDSF